MQKIDKIFQIHSTDQKNVTKFFYFKNIPNNKKTKISIEIPEES